MTAKKLTEKKEIQKTKMKVEIKKKLHMEENDNKRDEVKKLNLSE